MLQATSAPSLNRRGRKRKSGRRTPSGDLARPAVNYTALAAEQPHRASLPAQHREDPRAGTALGNLLLTGKLHSDWERAQALHEAGRLLAGVVSRYRSMIGAPRTTGGAGKGYGCVGEPSCDPMDCECRHRTSAYNSAFEAVSKLGHRVQIIVNRVVVHDEPCSDDHVPVLKIGLGALAKHFGLRAG